MGTKRPMSPSHRAAVDAANERKRIEREGWPRPTPLSSFAYDRAVEQREFGRHNLLVEQDDDRRFVPKPYVSHRSECGCSAEMAAT